MNNKKKYSVTAHLVHSRLEMIKADIVVKISEKMWEQTPKSQNVCFDNSWLIRKVCESIERDFSIKVSDRDRMDGMELFLFSQQSTPRKEADRYKVQQFTESGWVDVTQEPGNNLNKTKLNFKEACAVYNYVSSGKAEFFTIVKC